MHSAPLTMQDLQKRRGRSVQLLEPLRVFGLQAMVSDVIELTPRWRATSAVSAPSAGSRSASVSFRITCTRARGSTHKTRCYRDRP